MEENNIQKPTTLDALRHYLASVIIYGIILLFLIFCPAYYETISNENFDYTGALLIYYVGYIFIAPIIFFGFKPQSLLKSRSITIFNYIARQFQKDMPLDVRLKDIEPKENEKQALMTLFVQTFFGVYCVNMLCNNYLPNFGYNIDFLKVMFEQAVQYTATNGFFMGAVQYFIDTGDMWLKLIMTVSTIILTISYLSETSIFKNKIKSTDTTPLGVLSCIICYYPITLLTNKFIQVTEESLLPVQNDYLLAVLNLLVILVNLGSLIAILRLGTKAGNLTNRGIVTKFPYNIIRHPDYTMQILYIIVTTVPLYLMSDMGIAEKILVTFSTFAWVYIYYLRAITEERHLIKDPEYQKYAKKVKHRFIPKIF